MNKLKAFIAVTALITCAFAQQPKSNAGCGKVPHYSQLKAALKAAVKEGKVANSGLCNQEWSVVVNRERTRLPRRVQWPNLFASMPGQDAVPTGVASRPSPNDNMILDIQDGNSPSGVDHATCKGGQPPDKIAKQLATKYPVGPKL